MDRLIKLLIISSVCILLCSINAFATPLDLSDFQKIDEYGDSLDDLIVTESGGTVIFTEDIDYSAIFFANDAFDVGTNDTILSFDYSLILGDQNDDWLVVIIDYVYYEMEIGDSESGSWEIDLTDYQGTTISLAFGLESNDLVAGTTATISNIDLANSGTTPVPEPATVILFGIGLVGLIRRKLLFPKTNCFKQISF